VDASSGVPPDAPPDAARVAPLGAHAGNDVLLGTLGDAPLDAPPDVARVLPLGDELLRGALGRLVPLPPPPPMLLLLLPLLLLRFRALADGAAASRS